MVWVVPVDNNKVGKKTGREIIRPILPEMEELIVDAMYHNDSEYFLTNDNDLTPMGNAASIAAFDTFSPWLSKASVEA